MKKNLIVPSLLVLTFLFSACADEDGTGKFPPPPRLKQSAILS